MYIFALHIIRKIKEIKTLATMKRLLKHMFLFVLMVWGASFSMAQQSSLAYLEQTYPQLTDLYREALRVCGGCIWHDEEI